MNEIPKNVKKLFENIDLRKEEKTRLRERLFNFMRNQPIHAGFSYPARSPYFMIPGGIFRLIRPIKVLSAALIIVIVMAGSVSYAAERSLPGEIFYPIKINVNEEVKGMLLKSPEEKAAWEIERTGRRLQEAAKLTMENKMTPVALEEIKEGIDRHTNKVDEEVKKIESQIPEKSLEINSQLESSLNSHGAVLLALKEKTEANGDLDEIVSKTQEKVAQLKEGNQISKDLIIQDNSSLKKQAVETKIGEISGKVGKIKEIIDGLEIPISRSLAQKVDEKIIEIENLQEKIKEEMINQKYGQAFVFAQEADQNSEELTLLILLGKKLAVNDVETTSAESEKSTEESAVEGGIKSQETEGVLETDETKTEAEPSFPEVREGTPVKMGGKTACLPYRESVPAALNFCVVGFQDKDGQYYELATNQKTNIAVNLDIKGQDVYLDGILIPALNSVFEIEGIVELYYISRFPR